MATTKHGDESSSTSHCRFVPAGLENKKQEHECGDIHVETISLVSVRNPEFGRPCLDDRMRRGFSRHQCRSYLAAGIDQHHANVRNGRHHDDADVYGDRE
jgi:hypothetical protein